MSAYDDFEYRAGLLANMNYNDATPRLSDFWKWLNTVPETKRIIDEVRAVVDVSALMPADMRGRAPSPNASSPEEIASVGFKMMEDLASGKCDALRLSHAYGVRPSFNTSSVQDHFDAVWSRYIEPAIGFVRRVLASSAPAIPMIVDSAPAYPPVVTESLMKFRDEHPDPTRAAFVMMQFGKTKMHDEILAAIRSALGKYGIKALRADDKQYHDDLFPNVMTYMHGCGFGIAVFERLEADEFNPNVSLEVGYMRGLRKNVCLLKDRTLKTLQSDLVGSLYRSFDPQAPSTTIPSELVGWLSDKDIITV